MTESVLPRRIGLRAGFIYWLNLIKTPNKPETLRPICLQHPMKKVLSNIHCRLILHTTYDFLRQMPLFACLPNRGTKDCLLIVSAYCRRVRELYTEHKGDDAKKGLWGGIQISLDMEKILILSAALWFPGHFMLLICLVTFNR